MTYRIRYTTALLACCLLPSALWAQGAQSSDPDAKELASYRLTMETLKKVETAGRVLLTMAKQDPRFQKLQKVEAEIDALENKEEMTEADMQRMEALQAQKDQLEQAMDEPGLSDAKTLDEMEANLKKSSMFSTALQQAGLTPREYSKFMMAMVQAAFAAGFKKAGMLKELPPGVNPDNVKFVEEHEADLKAMQAGFEKMSKGGANEF